MAALALDQREGKHPPGRCPRAGPLEAPAGAEGASRACVPTVGSPPFHRPTRVACFRVARRRTGPPAGGPRLPGRAPGGSRGPQGARGPERPLARGPASSALFPPLSRLPPPPAWVILRLRALWGRSPETPSSTTSPPVLLLTAAPPQPLSPPEAPRRPSRRTPPGAAKPLALARPAPAPTPLRLARLSRISPQCCLLSQDWFRGGRRRAVSPPARAPRLGPGAASCRRSRSLPSAVPAPDRPPSGPLARFFLMQTAVH
ncbi:unnamed protein product [Rangifer tarandus platyrhynchus]|uniref:Basic proline-rich protein-like n=1 Tax=Rangifer tarandus platyrhynchus TaxID=3082113 RepID=A0ABN9A2R3_RANTA|nr:unnamed protein product [Rangifer tarandus platyrhynchus]